MTSFVNRKVLLPVFVFLCGAAAARAQNIPREPDPTAVRVRLGPLWLSPTVALTNAGVDTNVFNEATADTPERDFTVALSPATDWWLRMGRTWITGNIKDDLVWYQKFASERSVNSSYTAGWLAPLNRLTLSVGGNWLSTRERPGFEIDARSRRFEKAGNGSVEIRALAKTFFGARGGRRKIEFDQDAVYLGSSLETELNRTVTSTAFTVRNQLTPLTSISLAVGREKERFEFSPLRDSDSTRYDVALSLDAFALINGSAQIGFRDFKPLSPDLPGYSGSTALINLSYVALGSTKLSVSIGRDIQYSYDVNHPYFLQTGIIGSFAQQIYGPLDVEGRLGRQRLAYTQRERAAVPVANRVDRYKTYGVGVGYRLGSDLRVGFNIDNATRVSALEFRQYDGLRYGFAVTYGL
jgi:hypothetical protein